MNMYDEIITRALDVSGIEYLKLEKQLRDGGREAMTALAGRLNDADPIARLMALELLEWMRDHRPDNAPALEYLESLPAYIATLPIPAPPPDAVTRYLQIHYEERVAALLALRLLKGDDWPLWQIMAVLGYLAAVRDPIATVPLIRFALRADDPAMRHMAGIALNELNDPNMAITLAAERKRAEELGIPFPPFAEITTGISSTSKPNLEDK
ncbi:MAG: hypothetical protein ABIR47_03395 [Candidatus Kapaibacterium sp.]